MQKTVKRTILACIAGLLMIIGLSFGQSEKIQAYGNEQIYGLVFWGTSGVSRMYTDLGDENYENTEDSGHRGTQEQVQHLWTSYLEKDYGYLNYADFTNLNYWVGDAKGYASVGNVSKNQRDLSGVLQTLNSNDSKELGFGYTGSDDSWDECKTAVVIWAGEDWVVRNSTGTDKGLSSASELQIDWMGQICAEEDTHGTHETIQNREYTTGDTPETQDLDLNVQDLSYDTLLENYKEKYPDRDVETDVPSMDELREAYDYSTLSGYSGSGHDSSSTSTILIGTKTTGHTHKLVFDNSYMISEEHLAQYSYSSASDGIERTLEHELEEPTDAFPADEDLPNQAALCFGRLLSGYSYTVEYLQQDTSVVPEDQDYDPSTIKIWVPEYHEAVDAKVTDYCPNQVPDYMEAKEDDETHERFTTTVSIEDTDSPVNRSMDVSVEWIYSEKDEVYYPSGQFTWPAYYIWNEVEVEVPIRCDTDRSASYGYADSSDTHEYGGFDGLAAGDVVSGDAGSDYQQAEAGEEGLTNVSYFVDDSAENYDADGNPCESHGSDYTEHTEWYTDLDKPIMKVVTETREVEGWIEYWKENTTSSLKVYVFGLGPYNKAYYEDQMDDCWWDNSKNQTQVEQTQRIDQARQTWNSILEANISGGQFMSLWDEILDRNPYYRYQNITTSSMDQSDNAMHGKWYNRQTYQEIFHMIWNTVLEDNPNPEGDPDIDMSLYSLSSSLTSYANNVLFGGREDDNGNDTHSLPEIAAMSAADAGDILGCGDEDYDFSPYLTTVFSQSAYTTSYSALLQNDETNNVYKYARYGHLLSDLGIDEIGEEETTFSTRSILGMLMSVAYIADAGLVFIWDLALSALEALNPFQIFKYASSISSDFKSGMYDESSSWIIQWASNNEMINGALKTIGEWYDALSNIGMLILMILFVVLLVSVFLIQSRIARFEQQNPYGGTRERQEMWQRIGRYAIRFLFIIIGVPLMGMIYTEVLDSVDAEMQVAAVPATEMVKATFVDFGGWIDTSRLDPVDGMTLESVQSDTGSAGMASDDSIENVRKTAIALNNATGIMPDVDASHFTSIYADEWNNNAWVTYNVSAENSAANQIFSDSSSRSNSTPSYVEQWANDFDTLTTAFNFIRSWSNGSFYYASDFNSVTMTQFSGQHSGLVGRQKGIDEDVSETGWNNDNTLHQLFEECVGLDNWMDRSQEDNEKITTEFSAYASGSEFGNKETHEDRSNFNVMANGGLSAEINGSSTATAKATSTIVYSGSTEQGDSSWDGTERIGTDITQQVGLSTLSMYNYLMTDFGDSMITVYSPVKAAAGNIQKMHYSTTLVGNGALQWVFFASCFAFMFVAAVIGIGYALGMLWSILRHSFSLIGNIPFAMIGVVRSIVQVVLLIVGMILEILATMILYEIICDLMMMLLTLLESPLLDSITATFENSMSASATAVMSGGILGSVSQILPECMTGSLAGFIVYLIGSVFIVMLIAVQLIRLHSKLAPILDKAVEWSLVHIYVSKDIRGMILQNEESDKQTENNKERSDEDVFFPAPVTAQI